MCTLSLEIIFTVSFSYHFTVWPHLIHYLSYHLCRMDVMSGRRCQSIGIINGDWIHTAHSIRFDSIFPSSNAALHGTVQRGRAGAEYSRSSVRDSHLHVFKVYIKKIQLVRWRETWFAPNRRIECERHWRNTAKRNKKKKKNESRQRQLCFSFFTRWRVQLECGCSFFVPVSSCQNIDLIRTNRIVCDTIKMRFR